MNRQNIRNTLVANVSKDKKLLTLELDLDTLAEFSVAARLFGIRSNATFVNQFVVQKIREGRGLVSEKEWFQLVEDQKKLIEERSRRKSAERRMPRTGTITLVREEQRKKKVS